MARTIDDSKPLSAEDRAWLASRNRFDEITRIDELHGDDKPDAPEPIQPPPATGSEIDRLGNYLLEHFPSDVPENRFQNGETPVDVAIVILDRSLDAPESAPADPPVASESEQHSGEAASGGEGSSGSEPPADPQPQEPVVDGTTAQDLGLDTNLQQVAETPEQRPAQMSDARTADTYDDWTNDELKDELGKRELSKSGVKSELIARLREDDE